MKGVTSLPLKYQAIIASVLVFFSIGSCDSSINNNENSLIKGIYGDPGTLLKAGHTFKDLGVNALFVRSHSLNDELYDTAREQGCKIFVEFPVLLGKQFIKDNPHCSPIEANGQASAPADWFMGICPTCPDFKDDRKKHLESILNKYKVDGVFLDYLHWHAQFETPEPILPETCFCDRCTRQFSKEYQIDLPKGSISEISNHILTNHDKEWRKWRSDILTEWITDLKQIVKNDQPTSLVGLFYCAWYPEDFNGALYRNLGINMNDFVREADVLAPMLFHKLSDRPVNWVGEYTSWLDAVSSVTLYENKPEIWPIVQAYNNPTEVSPEEFKKVLELGSSTPSSGIMMFSDRALLDDPRKLEIMKVMYLEEHN